MTQANLLTLQFDQLQQQHDALARDFAELQQQVAQQQVDTEQWLLARSQQMQREAQEQRRLRRLQAVFHHIAERATAGLTFFEFSRVVHELLGELMYARNFFVCLFNAGKNTVDFPYYVDERDGDTMQCNDVPARRGLTEFVLRSQQPQRIDAARFAALQRSGDITEATGDLSFTSWLGVPMQISGAIGGVLAVQRYDAGDKYSAADADILGFVANHFSSAIERYQAVENLRKSELRYRTIIEKVGMGVVVIQGGKAVFVNPFLVDIVGYPEVTILSRPLQAFLHPDDVASVARHYARRKSGASLDPHYSARIITAQGQSRWLELSAVPIEWNRRQATLLFAVDITERRLAEQTQRQALQRQAELNAMKSSFIAMASHEFRTPLASIHGSVDLLWHYDDRLSTEQRDNALHKVDDAVQRMTQMLENVLLIGSADARPLAFNPRRVALTPFVLGMIDELRSSMAEQMSQVTLTQALPDARAMFWLDETLLRNMLGNLLSNAVKYAKPASEVFLSAFSGDKNLVITVLDHGIGIPPDDLPHLFERFHRASNVGLITGTGLGLSIVKDAATAHHGSIAVQSEVGRGSCFTLTLPTGAPA